MAEIEPRNIDPRKLCGEFGDTATTITGPEDVASFDLRYRERLQALRPKVVEASTITCIIKEGKI